LLCTVRDRAYVTLKLPAVLFCPRPHRLSDTGRRPFSLTCHAHAGDSLRLLGMLHGPTPRRRRLRQWLQRGCGSGDTAKDRCHLMPPPPPPHIHLSQHFHLLRRSSDSSSDSANGRGCRSCTDAHTLPLRPRPSAAAITDAASLCLQCHYHGVTTCAERPPRWYPGGGGGGGGDRRTPAPSLSKGRRKRGVYLL
jgi:hypothetical protein